MFRHHLDNGKKDDEPYVKQEHRRPDERDWVMKRLRKEPFHDFLPSSLIPRKALRRETSGLID
jgi:hypothetical protein